MITFSNSEDNVTQKNGIFISLNIAFVISWGLSIQKMQCKLSVYHTCEML